MHTYAAGRSIVTRDQPPTSDIGIGGSNYMYICVMYIYIIWMYSYCITY